MKLQLKTITGLDPELVASSTLDPASILMELEARFNREEPEALFDDLQITHGLLPRIPRAMLRRQFGKWLPKGADAIVAATNEYLTTHATERGYPLDASDLIASTVFNVQRIADLEKWKAEQTVIRRAQRHYLKQETSKQLVDGKRQWVDATVYELPPLMQSEGKSLKHEDARYAIRLPDGRYFDLGQTDGSFKPILSDGPDIAMQRIAKRAGLTLRGGAHSIVQVLTGLTGIIPAYTTVWHRHQWLVIVGWQRDPKTTLSSYYKGDNELSKAGDPDDRLTLSELDYQLLKGAAEGEIEDFEGNVVDYMNDEEELVLHGLMRDESDDEEPLDNPLLTEVAEHLGLLIELRTGSAVWTHPEFEQVLIHLIKGRHANARLVGGAINRTKRLARSKNAHLMSFLPPEDKAQLEIEVKAHWREINRLRRVRRRIRTSFHDQLEDLRSQAELVTTEPMESVRAMFVNKGMDDTMRIRYLPHSDLETGAQAFETGIATTEAMTVSQANAVIEHHKVTEVAEMPAHRVSVMNRVKRGTTALVETKHGIVAKRIDPLPQPVLTARNASPTLKARLRAMIREELESGTHEQEVADTFAIALEQALRGALRA